MKKSLVSLLLLSAFVCAQESDQSVEAELEAVEKESREVLDNQKLREENERLKRELLRSENEKLKQENLYLKQKMGLPSKAVTNTTVENSVESWYFNFGLGSANIVYPEAMKVSLDTLEESNSSIDRANFSIDIGFYWTISRSFIMGFNINGHADQFINKEDKLKQNTNIFNYALSSIYYFSRVDSGLFLRGDIGRSIMIVEDSSIKEDRRSDFDTGFALGAGYAFDFGGTSLQITYIVTDYSIEGESIKSQQIMFAGLF